MKTTNANTEKLASENAQLRKLLEAFANASLERTKGRCINDPTYKAAMAILYPSA